MVVLPWKDRKDLKGAVQKRGFIFVVSWWKMYKCALANLRKKNFRICNIRMRSRVCGFAICGQTRFACLPFSVPDPNPDPPDPHVFGPPGSGSTSQRYGSGSGSFYHHAKILRITLIPTILWLFLTFYLWKMM